MHNKLLIASHNKGKVKEFQRMLNLDGVELLSLEDQGITFEAVECGKTFQENSEIKAKVYGNLSGLITLADDSGLSVDSLNGAPGVLSARYGGENLSDEDRVELLLNNMRNVPVAERQAKFIRSLKNALIRIENNTYGICRVTGKLIAKERLKLVPHATLSIEAKNAQ